MTQVKEWSNQELNRKLTELLGYKVVKEESTGKYRMVNPQGKEFGMSRPTEGLVWNDYAYPFCTDPAASLEVQTAATKLNAKVYVDTLYDVRLTNEGYTPEIAIGESTYSHDGVVYLFNASPRERAEAAYITLSQVTT